MTTQVGVLMKQWRTDRGISQFRLALLTGMSQRHLSFIETGRSRPSRATVLAVARALVLSPQQTDLFLVRAGFRPQARSNETAPAQTSHWQKILHQLPPAIPAAIVNDAWDVQAQTAGFDHLFANLRLSVDKSKPLNLLTLFMSPSPICEWVHEGQTIGRSLLQHLIATEPSYPDRSRVSEVISELRAALNLLALNTDASTGVLPSVLELVLRPPESSVVHLGIVSTYLASIETGNGIGAGPSFRLLLVNLLDTSDASEFPSPLLH